MTDRNLKKELNHYVYNDPEYGEDIEHIDYDVLISVLQELLERVEQLETSLKATQRYISGSYE